MADDLIEPRRGGENTGRRWSEAKPLQISQESILNPDGVTEILSDLREGGLSPASPPALSKKGGSSASRTKASPSSPSVAPPCIRSALRDLYTCGPPWQGFFLRVATKASPSSPSVALLHHLPVILTPLRGFTQKNLFARSSAILFP